MDVNGTKQSHTRLAGLMLILAALACSNINDVIGQRPARPTPTPPAFSTATPGGRLSVPLETPETSGTPTPDDGATPIGQIVGPAATATAIAATVQAATAIAASTPALSLFALSECPAIGAPPAPAQPGAFNLYPETIGRYLSAGGPTTLLEALLRDWGAINEGAVVQADTDLTGDGVAEVIVTAYDPAAFVAGQASPGALFVYGCAQRGYRLLYSTLYGPGTVIPELRRVGDMNGDVRPELVYSQQTCQAGRCAIALQILSWSGALGAFSPLNSTPISTNNARVLIADLDDDGILEVSLSLTPAFDAAQGPQRRSTEIWDWDGQNYRLAVVEIEAPVYRIHALHDADMLLEQGDLAGAIRLYDQVRDDAALQPWNVPNEPIVLRAYAGLRKMIAQAASDSRRAANVTYAALESENPAGTPGQVYAALAKSFIDNFNRNRSPARACVALFEAAQERPDALIPLNSYGYGNRAYTFADLCPFRETANS